MAACRAIAVLGLLAAVGGCAEDKLSHAEMLSDGWLFPTGPAVPAAPLYCYRTLATLDCHSGPLADAGDRLVAFQGPLAR